MTNPNPTGHPPAPPPVDPNSDRAGWQARAQAAEAMLKEWVEYHEEFDAYPTSDQHPLYKTRKLLGLEEDTDA